MPHQLHLFGSVGPTGHEAPSAHDGHLHRVSAHVRLRANGEEVFVHEHFRWSRGRAPATPALGRAPAETSPAQLALFSTDQAG